jgi:hypothetical protein
MTPAARLLDGKAKIFGPGRRPVCRFCREHFIFCASVPAGRGVVARRSGELFH